MIFVLGLFLYLHLTYWNSSKSEVMLNDRDLLEDQVLQTVSHVLQDLHQIVNEMEQSNTNIQQASKNLKRIRKECKQVLQTIDNHKKNK